MEENALIEILEDQLGQIVTHAPWQVDTPPHVAGIVDAKSYVEYTIARVAELCKAGHMEPDAWPLWLVTMSTTVECGDLMLTRDVCKSVIAACVRLLLGESHADEQGLPPLPYYHLHTRGGGRTPRKDAYEQ